MNRLVAGIALLVLFPVCAQPQPPTALTLERSVSMAVAKGFTASDVKAKYLAAKKNAESARRRLWTSVGLTVNLPNYQESLSQQFNPYTGRYEYYQLNSTNMQAALTVNQPLVFTGGNLRFSQLLLSRDQTSGLAGATQQFKDYFGNFSIEFTQPILTPNVSAITQTANEVALAQAETDFLADQMDLVYNVTDNFYSVYQLTVRLEIAREQVSQNEESFNTATGKFKAGLIPEVDALQSDVDLASSRNDFLTAERELKRAKNSFRLLLGIPTEEDLSVTGDVEYTPVLIDSALAVESALHNRSEVLSAQRRIQLAEGGIGTAKSRNDFRLDVTARYGLDRNDTLLQNVFHDFNRSRSASLMFSVPIFDWGSNSLGVEAAEVQYKNAMAAADYVSQQVRQDVIDLLNRIQVAESRIHVLEKSVAVAQKGYDMSLQRFRNGAITSNDLTLSQQRLTSAKNNSLNALIDYKIGIADLKRRTLWDFETNGPVKPIMGDE
jgi:outer membrane protein TolC